VTQNKDNIGTILIIDDTPASIGVMQSILEQTHYRVLVATSGEKALEIVDRIQPDLILLDIMMTGINGYETCRRLKNKLSSHSIPIIFLSALTEASDRVQAFRNGGVDYLTKPIDPEELLIRVKTHLSINRLEIELQNANRNLEQKVEERTGELEQAYADLQEREELFRGIFEGSPVGIEIYDKDGRLKFVNQAQVEIFGLEDPEEITGYNLFTDPNLNKETIRKIREGQSFQYEDIFDFSLVREKGLFHTIKKGILYYRAIISVLHTFGDERITGFIMIFQDITDQKLKEKEIQEAIEQITKNEVTFSILNDQIRNPLSIMAILCEDIDPKISDEFNKCIHRIDGIVNQLDYSTMQSEKVRSFLMKHYGIQ
jgi:PAS domain S-box-containing protein